MSRYEDVIIIYESDLSVIKLYLHKHTSVDHVFITSKTKTLRC